MELKKSKEADLESRRYVFFFVGLVMVSSIVLMSLTFVSADIEEKIVEKKDDDKLGAELVYEMPPEEEIPEEEPQQAPPPPQIEEPEIVDDEQEIDEFDFSDLGDEVDDVYEPEPIKIVEEPIVDFAEVDPAFPGGEAAMGEWIQKNIVYPEMAKEMGEQGTVYVQFVVNRDGSIVDVVIVRGVSESLDNEAKRVVKKMPKWSPGEQAGKPVRVRFTLPINFRLG